VARIGLRIFDECQKLTSIHCKNATPASDVFEPFSVLQYETITLYVPKGSREAYMNADPWYYFTNIIEE
jgi:hypothetical protein